MKIFLPDASQVELKDGSNGYDLALSISEGLARNAVALSVNDEVKDIRTELKDGDKVRILTSKDEEIKKYSEDLGSTTNGTVYYYLMMIQKYSVPVCFIGLTIASLNFFIIGNKKLDKREQGFGMLIAFGLGLIVFQVLPLLFAIIVAGR